MRGFFQAKLMTFVSIVTIAITLFSLGCISIVFINIQRWLHDASSEPGISAFINDHSYRDSLACLDIQKQIESFPEVKSVMLISKQDAWNEFEKEYGKEMLDAVDENPLPASFQITLKPEYLNAEDLTTLKEKLESLSTFESITYSHEWVSTLQRFRRKFSLIASVIAAILMVALHYMIANTIKLTIYARKDLITNMHFVGATDFYIKTPFILEGMLQGLIGGLLGIVGLNVLQLFLVNFSFYWGEWFFYPVILLIGIFFGWIGSLSAVRKFLV